jgi:hypothetical protein
MRVLLFVKTAQKVKKELNTVLLLAGGIIYAPPAVYFNRRTDIVMDDYESFVFYGSWERTLRALPIDTAKELLW